MTAAHVERRLAAILAADVVSYSRLMSRDEMGTLKRVRAQHASAVAPAVQRHGGRIFKLMGDGLLAEFPSVVEAVRCAVVIQTDLSMHDADLPEDQRLRIRIGVHLGDIIPDGGDIFGDGVNVTAASAFRRSCTKASAAGWRRVSRTAAGSR